jgi:uncharacterized protein (TIGR03084 family)
VPGSLRSRPGCKAADVDALCDDVAAEHVDLDRLVSSGSLADLDRPTPAPGWSVGDQISHLWYFDQQALLALTDPDAFRASTEQLLATVSGGEDPSVAAGRAIGPAELLERWRADRRALVSAARTVDPKARVPWYGPAMSARSFLTARLMETWAHGLDVVDALGAERRPTARLRHVAHIGVGARAFSYVTNGRQVPDADVFVRLDAPDGDEWTWGDPNAPDRVDGPALDFCLLVTQRRHRSDTAVRATGPAAHEWLDIAQAFAGPPGPGRSPGALS